MGLNSKVSVETNMKSYKSDVNMRNIHSMSDFEMSGDEQSDDDASPPYRCEEREGQGTCGTWES